jgi:hypothetical protein
MKIKTCLITLAALLLMLSAWVFPVLAADDWEIRINNGVANTTSRNVTLNLNLTGATQMRFCDEHQINAWTAWVPYAASYPWTLSEGDGIKTVYVQVLDATGHLYPSGVYEGAVCDDIILDTTAPTGTIIINSGTDPFGDEFATRETVVLTLSTFDHGGSGVSQMCFSNDNINWSSWGPYSSIKEWTLTSGDGLKTVYARFKDQVGYVSPTVSDTITLDTNHPTNCSVAINGGARFTANRSVNLTLSATDDISGPYFYMRLGHDDSNWSSWEPYDTAKLWTLTSGADGLRRVCAQFKDRAGNETEVLNDYIILDTTGPTGTILINGGAASTNGRTVTLTPSARDDLGSGVAQMRLSNSSTFTGAFWEDYSPNREWDLTSGDGVKTVYAQFKDALGNTSVTTTDAITLDTSAPTGTLTINGGATATNNGYVTLNLNAPGASQMRFSDDNSIWSAWVAYAASWHWNLSSGDGSKTVYAQFKDDLGNSSGSVTATITLDTAAPTGNLSINNDADVTNNRIVNLNLFVVDQGSGLDKMAFSNDGVSFSTLEPFAGTKTWNLTAGDGLKWVSVKCLDKAGNSFIFARAITLDNTPPTGNVTINGGAVATNTTAVTLTTDAPAASQMRFSNNNSTWSAWEAYPAIKPWTLASGDGLKTVYAQFKDEAGNLSTVVSDTITLDTATFSGNLTINNGASYTNSLEITLNLNAPGATQMRFSANNINWPSYWVPYAATTTYSLTSGQGLKTVYAQFKNAAGTTSPTVSAAITLDSAPPTGSIVINNDASGTNNRLVTLNLTAADSGSGLDKMAFSNDGNSFSAPEPYAATKIWNLTTGDGTKFVYVNYTDKAGNVATLYDTLTLDTTPPTATVTFVGGATNTSSTGIRLVLNAPGVTPYQMRFSNDNNTWSAWEAYFFIKDWTLSSGDGLKTVFAQFKDNLDNASTSTATITLDTTAPTGSLRINGGANLTNLLRVSLSPIASDAHSGLDKMAFSNDGVSFSTPEPFATITTWDLSPDEGAKQVFARYFDKAGNFSTGISATITLDYTPPTGSITINGGDSQTNITGVTLTLSATDAREMCFNNGNSAWSAWEAYTASKFWILSNGDGVKWVYARFRDEAGNISDTVADSITLDTASPSGTVSINSGAACTKTNSVILAISATGNANQMQFSNDASSWSTWEGLVGVKSWSLSSGDGLKTVFLRFKDGAGNLSGTASAQIILDATAPRDGALIATPRVGAVNLTWSGFSDATSGLKTYRLYHGTSGLPSSAGDPIFQGTDLSFTQTGLDLKQAHYYRLVAEDLAGNISPGVTAQTGAAKAKNLPFLFLLLN